jgi:hypothetical protein
MKFPSLIRLPRNRKFGIEPRYYDPIKEEIEERTRLIKQEMEGTADGTEYVHGRISFQRKTQSVPNASLMQLAIAAFLGILIIGWLYVGNDIFYYMLFAAVPVYVYLRFIRKRGK